MMRTRQRTGTRLAILVLSAGMLSGCAEMNLFGHYAKKAVSEPPPAGASATSTYKIGKPYQIKGVWYYPQEDFDYAETGIASWYGPDFHGKLTANGESFDQNAVTAAHRTLPMPSVVRVTNLENGRSLVVRVNDRGPFAHGRVIDLSRRAAQLLGFEGQGTARVRVEIMADESRVLAGKAAPSGSSSEPEIVAAPRGSVTAETLPPPGSSEPSRPVVAHAAKADTSAQRAAAAAEATERVLASQEVTSVAVHSTGIFVQAGSFSRHDNALRLSARLSGVGHPNVEQVSVKGKTWYRVRFGPISSIDEADRVLESVIAAGQQDARVIVD
ncbi:septal ring lytic transglycosylase RlpA family protein [Magnetospirillum sulfuroxidans]|uniref:Endolytic peptidoglycan transglycosylase RlpA n=1 Tax=Magnetospirillum sulfuroxidans TaxID=611300 RepID=A0ABS5I8J2_9PROT|nr:septal ring lytic transglycosylase RlpA family protein [Magnetospirillum sulfuroxidans]MBR9970576.1 septal ring lytic transglycosylase RlpA family protein [Magnetospirillum sulfuroxidans]